MIDVGTDNANLLNDPLIWVWRHPRIRGEAYFQFVDEIVQKLKKRFPRVLLQWEILLSLTQDRSLSSTLIRSALSMMTFKGLPLSPLLPFLSGINRTPHTNLKSRELLL